jgi:uncharacterized protein YecA (UPF0149 family)
MEKAPSVAVIQQWIQILSALVTLAILIQTTYFKKTDQELQKQFMDHLLQENKELNQRQSLPPKATTYRRPTAKIQRNDPCPCGSEKKYKLCCGQTGG